MTSGSSSRAGSCICERQTAPPKPSAPYIDTARDSLGDFLLRSGYPTNVADIASSHMAAYQADQLERFSPSTAALRHRTLKVFFKWLVNEGEIPSSPMEHLAPPKVGEIEVPVIPIENVRRLLAVCKGANFDDRRDAAIIHLFYDTGLRLSEMAGVQVQDVDVANRVLHVTGKGNKGRAARYGTKAATAVNRYLRERGKHSERELPNWWIGSRGAMTPSGIAQMLRRRCDEAGLARIHPHQFRHSFAAAWMADGGSEGDLMALAGWASRDMLARYGRYTAAERALSAHELHAPGDQL